MRLLRYCVASFIIDGTFYILWTVLPFLLIKFGANSWQQGLLPMITGVTYIIGSIYFGWLSDRVSHAVMMRAGLTLTGSAMLLLMTANGLDDLYTIAPIASLGTAMFWPTIQGAIGRETPGRKLDRALGWFNVCWSTGKALGFFAGGWLLAEFKPANTLLIAGLATGSVLLILPFRNFKGAVEAQQVELPHAPGFMRAAWIGNFAAFAVANILNTHYPVFLTRFAHLEEAAAQTTFGNLLGAIFMAQTVAFSIMLASSFWTYRWTPVLLLTLIMGAAVFWLPYGPPMIPVAVLIGVGLGMAYNASIFYSLHGPKMQGLKAGIHEGIIGSANVIPPLVAGLLAEKLGDLRWPYWTAAAIAGACLLGQVYFAAMNKSAAQRVTRA
jgi:MFS family permease